jgi:hypothetical protein
MHGVVLTTILLALRTSPNDAAGSEFSACWALEKALGANGLPPEQPANASAALTMTNE